jgi:hypothetical protein
MRSIAQLQQVSLNSLCETSHYYAQQDPILVSPTFDSDPNYPAVGIRESCDRIPYIVSHTLLHMLPTIESAPDSLRRDSKVTVIDSHSLNTIY